MNSKTQVMFNTLYRAIPDDRYVDYDELVKLTGFTRDQVAHFARLLKDLGLVDKRPGPVNKHWPVITRIAPKEVDVGAAVHAQSALNTPFKRKEEISRAISAALETAKEYVPTSKLMALVGASASQVTMACRGLMREGTVVAERKHGYKWVGQKANMKKAFKALDNVLTKQEQERLKVKNENLEKLQKKDSPVVGAKELPRPYNYKVVLRQEGLEREEFLMSITLPELRCGPSENGPGKQVVIENFKGEVLSSSHTGWVHVTYRDGHGVEWVTKFGEKPKEETEADKPKKGFWSTLFGTN